METTVAKSSIYTVQKGDTLRRIANAHNTTPQELARANNITNIDIIKVGQHLLIPRPLSPAQEVSASATDDCGYLSCKFVDSLENPIANLKVWIKAGMQAYEYQTDSCGDIPSFEINELDIPVTVEVQKAAGGKKTVATFTAGSASNTSALLVSPKFATQAGHLVHEGKPPQQTKMQDTPPAAGTVINKRDENGHPVQQVFTECQNNDNLRLGIYNGKYRNIILEAAKQADIKPQAVAALINAEAGKKTNIILKTVIGKDKKPVIDKKTGQEKKVPRPDKTEWNERSIAGGDSSATGMTQFLDGAWIDMALREGTFVNRWVKSKGWLTTKKKDIFQIKNIVNTKTKKLEKVKQKVGEKEIPAFKLANGDLVTAGKKMGLAATLSHKPYMTGRRTASDKNIQALLDLRYVPEYSIRSAVESAVFNIEGLRRAGYPDTNLNDAEKAKIMYLFHHLGPGDAVRFIDNTISEEDARILLTRQFANNEQGRADLQKKYTNAGNNWVKAHRTWLQDFVNDRIQIIKFMCTAEGAPMARDVLVITDELKNKRSRKRQCDEI